MKTDLTVERVRQLLDYSPSTGEMFWKLYRNSKAVAGQLAGHKDKVTGYIVIGIDDKTYQAHRIAWLLHYG